jgi:hypothetical protein
MKFFQRKISPIVPTSNHINNHQRKHRKKLISIVINKRQKFVLAVILQSLGLFASGNTQLGSYAFQIALSLAVITDLFLLWSVYKDLKESFNPSIFILPFFYSLSFGLFYFLVPANLLFRIPVTVFYALGLYSLFLSQNVFAVASIRTIALLSGARIVSFVITLLSYFFLSNIIFSLHLSLVPMVIAVTVSTYFLTYQSIGTYALQKAEYPTLWQWSLGVTLCLMESAVILWFWPSSPTIVALFLTGFFYTLVGLSHIWFEKRLFKSVMWEYVWVGVVVFFVLIAFTTWGK